TERRSSVASITLLTRTETQPFPFLATGLTSLSRDMFEVFARPVRRVSSSTSCLAGPWRQFSQSADAWTSFYGWWPKRRYFSSSKMRIPARSMANPHASSKPPARDADTRERELNFFHRFGAKRQGRVAVDMPVATLRQRWRRTDKST